MNSSRQRPLALAGLLLAVIWLLAISGFVLARHAKMTAEKVHDYIHGLSLAGLSPEQRAKALAELARRINSLSAEERRKARLYREWGSLFPQMTETEKNEFLE